MLVDTSVGVDHMRRRNTTLERRRDRFNNKYNALLDVWIALILGTAERNAEVSLSAFDAGSDSENPQFRVATRADASQ
jgi:hypothetical protein